jgi:hypothetical protein
VTFAGSAASALATLLIGATFALRRLAASVVELTVGIVVGLCLLLALLGRIEQREGIESFRVREVLRVDRL